MIAMRIELIPRMLLAAGGLALLLACGAEPEDDLRLPGNALLDSDARRGGSDGAAVPERFGFGRSASAAEVAALDIDIGPDGAGLPPGRGTVAAGAALYAAQCASCHGANGEGTPAATRLVGREPIDSTGWNRTIGNYWPYAPTIFDYIRRTMPFDRPGSLADHEVYALTAYLLHLNEIVPADAVLDARSLSQVVMPARDRFVRDDREASTVVR